MSSSTRGTLTLLGLLVIIALIMWWFPELIPGGESDGEAESAPGEEWRVEVVYDGDTLLASRDGVEEKVRFIGIDTPEIGECGYAEAREALADLVEGRTVSLVPGAPTDRDDYGRMLRYVEVDGLDAGLWMLENGYAAEVYNSRRGKPHDREDEYIAADEATPDLCEFDAG